MNKLNKQQKQAVTHGEGPCMVVAGPGSGKTRVITYRVKYLIEKEHVSPANILVITFTRAAAAEMKNRFEQLMGDTPTGCTFGTFHSVFFMMLKAAYHYTGENVLAEDEKRNILKELIGKKELEYEDEEEFLQSVIREISLIKGDMISVEHYYSTSCGEEVFREIYKEYQHKIESMRKMDFDDMLVYCYELLTQRKDILSNWQKRFRYILIDEFQDINPIQYEIVKLLAKPKNNLFIVGDDDQSIYRFRGARPEIMLGFLKDYPNGKKIYLDINYRSSKDIVETAGKLILQNDGRFPKKMKADKETDTPVSIHYLKTRLDENDDIIKKLRTYYEQGIPYGQMAVIYRTNIQPRLLVSQFMSYNIPFQMRDGIPSIYEHFITQNIFDYVKVAMGDYERTRVLRILNKPKRYLSRDLLDERFVDFQKLKEKVSDKAWALENVEKLAYDLKMIAKLPPYGAINFIRKSVGYDSYLEEYAAFRKMKVEELTDVLNELMEIAKQFKTFGDWYLYIEEYQRRLEEEKKNNVQKKKNGVTLTTMHSAKGLEFEVVFILEANETITPYKKSVKDMEIEEERRMFYVAMTRARRYLHIYSIQELFNKELVPSRFLHEIS